MYKNPLIILIYLLFNFYINSMYSFFMHSLRNYNYPITQPKKNELNDLLIQLLENNQIDEAKGLIKNGKANVNYVNNDFKTPLIIALKNENFDMAEFLIEHGAHIKQKVCYGITLLQLFVAKPKALKFLLKHGLRNFYEEGQIYLSYYPLTLFNYDENFGGLYGMSPVDEAVLRSKLKSLLLMINHGADPLDILSKAAKAPREKIVREILKIQDLSKDQLSDLLQITQEEKINPERDIEFTDRLDNISALIKQRIALERTKESLRKDPSYANALIESATNGNIYIVHYILSLPLQRTINNPSKTLELGFLIAKNKHEISTDNFTKSLYNEIGRAILNKLQLIGEKGLISKQGLAPEYISTDLPEEVKLTIEQFKK